MDARDTDSSGNRSDIDNTSNTQEATTIKVKRQFIHIPHSQQNIHQDHTAEQHVPEPDPVPDNPWRMGPPLQQDVVSRGPTQANYQRGAGIPPSSALPTAPRPLAPATFHVQPAQQVYPGPALQGIPTLPPSHARRPPQPPPAHRRRIPFLARIVVALCLVLFIVTGIGFGYYQLSIAPKLNGIIGHEAIHHEGMKDGVVQKQQGGAATLNGNRVNILLLGSDTDGKNASPLAQTDIIVTIDPQSHYVGMLSIPRDMQVVIPGYWKDKMDAAFAEGYQGKDLAERIASAAGLAEDTIEYNYGIHIDHYAWVGLQGFVKVINTAGGVDVDALHPMTDDTYPDDVNNQQGNVHDYKRLYIAPGPQHLNGEQALEYVRTRHSDLVGDFGRSARQQQILGQLKTKLATTDTISKAPELLNDLNGAVQTDLQLNDIIQLANFARTVDLNTVERITFSPPYSMPASTTSNYLPVCDQIMPVIARMFAIEPKCIPQPASPPGGTTSSIPPRQGVTVSEQRPASTVLQRKQRTGL